MSDPAASPAPPARRRTQRERREETIAKLEEATLRALLELGYTGTTVQAICQRAGVSHGGLFRHFRSVLDLVLAAAERVAERQIRDFETRFQARFAAPGSDVPPLVAALELLREACRSPANAVFYELLVAARTHEELRRALGPLARRYYAQILATAERLPGIERIPAELREALVFTFVHLFDGETLVSTVLPRPDLAERRMEILARLLELVGSSTRAPRDA